MDILSILGRENILFQKDLSEFRLEIDNIVKNNSFLVIGGGGSIGQAVTKEIFARGANKLHVVDTNENYLVELVRDIRSDLAYQTADFDAFALDCGEPLFEQFMNQGSYDYVLNLSAMKHVRSENHVLSMLRMIKINIINTISTYEYAAEAGAKKYFCVSTDKAANPANFMGATKRAMELFLMRADATLDASGARFANVAFSNGSLLDGFLNRIRKKQPLSCPSDIQRFFVTEKEAGSICLIATILGEKNEILFPYREDEIKLNTFKKIASNFLAELNLRPVFCESEEEARHLSQTLDLNYNWPVLLFETDTVGEKPFEEFFSETENVNFDRFSELASIKFNSQLKKVDYFNFLEELKDIKFDQDDAKTSLIALISHYVPTFTHIDGVRYLNSRM